MSKVAIVGVEGSGKTVLMAALGEMYGQASHDSLYLMPENQAAFSFMTRIPHKMRVEHQWPEATAIESMKYLKWTVRIGTEVLTELEMLDYPGELYRMAFGDRKEDEIEGTKAQIHEFLEHLVTADFLIVLLNLKDAMDVGANARNNETVWLTRGIFDYAQKLPNIKNRLLVFTQADRYREILEGPGGAKAVQEKHLPMLSILHPDLECTSIAAIEAPESDAPGTEPTTDGGLQELMTRIVMASDSGRHAMELIRECEQNAAEAAGECSSLEDLESKIERYGKALAALGGAEVGVICALYPGTLDAHSERQKLLLGFAGDVRRIVSANPMVQLGNDNTWRSLVVKYDGLPGPLMTIKNIKNGYAKRNSKRKATIVAAGLLAFILAGAVIGGRHYKREKAVDQLIQATELQRDTCRQAVLGSASAQFMVGESFLADKPRQNRDLAAEWLGKAAAQGHEEAQEMLCELYYNAPLYRDEMPRNAATIEFFTKHAQQGAPWAQDVLGEIYFAGFGVPTNNEEALRWYKASAEGGNVFGMMNTGHMFKQGDEAIQDQQEAARWFRQAAAKGSAEAQYLLGIMYSIGVGVEQSDAEAKKWHQKASEQGDTRAKICLAELYLYGGSKIDAEKAYKLYAEAAEQGDAEAQYKVGAHIYADCTNKAEAAMWLRRAADQGETNAPFLLGQMYKFGTGVVKDQFESAKWYKQAADVGDVNAQNMMGYIYRSGDGVPQDDVESANWYRKAAEQGEVHAQYQMGFIYYNGLGVEEDYTEAAKWSRKAAEQGDENGQALLGVMYATGSGVPQDNQEAVKWLQQAADQGNDTAQLHLGLMHEVGLGVRQNDQEAFKWFMKAGEQKNGEAQFKLGELYAEGRGVRQNRSLAVEWFARAAAQGHTNAQESLCDLYYLAPGYLDEMPKDHATFEQFKTQADQGQAWAQNVLGELYFAGLGVPEDRAEALKWFQASAKGGNVYGMVNVGNVCSGGIKGLQNDNAAAKWYRTAAELGFTEAQYLLGRMYEDGQGVEKSQTSAMDWYKTASEGYQKAAEQGDVSAQFRLGTMYADGRGVAKDEAAAVGWYRKAAGKGHVDAQCLLGIMYDDGRGVAQDDAVAAEWYQKAAEQGDSISQYNLGMMYSRGEGVGQNYQEALKWYRKSAEQGFDYAQYDLGMLFANGRGVQQDLAAALEWIQKAADQGHVDAQLALKKIKAAQKEALRRQEAETEALNASEIGFNTLSEGEYVAAEKSFSSALAKLPDRPKNAEVREQISWGLAEAQYRQAEPLVMNNERLDTARNLVDSALKNCSYHKGALELRMRLAFAKATGKPPSEYKSK